MCGGKVLAKEWTHHPDLTAPARVPPVACFAHGSQRTPVECNRAGAQRGQPRMLLLPNHDRMLLLLAWLLRWLQGLVLEEMLWWRYVRWRGSQACSVLCRRV